MFLYKPLLINSEVNEPIQYLISELKIYERFVPIGLNHMIFVQKRRDFSLRVHDETDQHIYQGSMDGIMVSSQK